jgi:hypothetical protein
MQFLVSVEFALKHPEMFAEQTNTICTERARMFLQLSVIKEVTKSSSKLSASRGTPW